MRLLDDIAIRTRNGFWYYEVRKISRLKDAALDRKAFGGDCERRRHFEGIRRSWSSPDARQTFGGKTLLEVVNAWDASGDGRGPYADATRNFRSPFWKFVQQPNIPLEEYLAHIDKYVLDHGLVRLSHEDRLLYGSFLSGYEPALQYGATPAHSAILHSLAMTCTLDAMSVLIALFRVAMARGSLERAIAIRKAMRLSMLEMSITGHLPSQVAIYVSVLVEARVLANCWVSAADWKASDDYVIKKPSSTERIHAFCRYRLWFITHATIGSRYGDAPIVIPTSGILWAEQNREALVAAQECLDRARAEIIHDNVYSANEAQVSKHLAEVDRILRELPPRPTGLQDSYYDASLLEPADRSEVEEDPYARREDRIATLMAGWPRHRPDPQWCSDMLARAIMSPAK